jgi:rRNA maturation endonuclease Nob1
MPELSTTSLIAAFLLFLVIVVAIVKLIPRIMGRQCPKCLRRVPKGKTTCPACGATVNARTDLAK